jgi:hypothetical protein
LSNNIAGYTQFGVLKPISIMVVCTGLQEGVSLHAFSHSWEWFCWWRSGDLICNPWQLRIHKCFLQTHGWANYVAMLDQVGLVFGVILCLILETKVHTLLGAAYFTNGDSGVDSLSSSRCSCRTTHCFWISNP